ncbi:MAG: hypothetical protein ABH839_01830 [Chloroflexota bacterium]
MALVCGLIWGVVGGLVSFFYFNLLLAAGIGYATGEAVGLAVNRKRGAGLATIAGISVALSYLISNVALFGGAASLWVFFNPLHLLYDLAALGLGIFLAVSRLRK